MDSSQLLICCVVSLLTLRRDYNQIVLIFYCLYYIISDTLLQYDFLFYNQYILTILDLIVLGLCVNLLTKNNNKETVSGINIFLTVSISIILGTCLNQLIITDSILINWGNRFYSNLYLDIFSLSDIHLYLLSNWHYEFLTLLLINVKFTEFIDLSRKSFETFLPILGLTTIIYLTVINHIIK